MNKEDRANELRKILFTQEINNCDITIYDQIMNDYADIVDNMTDESNYWRSSLSTDCIMNKIDEISRLTDNLDKDGESIPKTLDIGHLCFAIRDLFQNDNVPNSFVKDQFVHDFEMKLSNLSAHSTCKRLASNESANLATINQIPPKQPYMESTENSSQPFMFQTAGSVLNDKLKKQKMEGNVPSHVLSQLSKRTLGGRRGPRSSFVLPIPGNTTNCDSNTSKLALPTNSKTNENPEVPPPGDERLKQFDQKIVDLILSEIMESKTVISWDNIVGLEFSKKMLQEIVILPILRPDLFTGLRGPPRGLLLFGPPGTGKTLIGKCIASQSNSTFFSISASSLTSKWVGEGEKMVRALFAIAKIHQPAVIFIDEVDSLLTQRSETEHESSRRIKTEFLVQLDGVSTGDNERVLFIGATNRPQELDEAARRRFVKRLYIPLPTKEARKQIMERLLKQHHHCLQDEGFCRIADRTNGYSGADMANLCREAAMGPLRSLTLEAIKSIACDEIRPVEIKDFEAALSQVRASVSVNDLDQYLKWNRQYGSFES